MTGSGLCNARMTSLGTASIRRSHSPSYTKTRERAGQCYAAAISAWFERAQYDDQYGRLHHIAMKGVNKRKEIVVEIRKLITTRETVFSELGVKPIGAPCEPREWRSSTTRSPVSSSRI